MAKKKQNEAAENEEILEPQSEEAAAEVNEAEAKFEELQKELDASKEAHIRTSLKFLKSWVLKHLVKRAKNLTPISITV